MMTWEDLRNEIFTEDEIQASKERVKKELKNMTTWGKIHEIEKETHFNYTIKEKIVKSGNSEIFNKWHEYGVREEDFLKGLKWLCDDPLFDRGMLTRELGCTPDGELVKLKRNIVSALKGYKFTGFYRLDTGFLWEYHVSISARDRI